MLTLEDQCLKQICASDLSVRELHVIEAVSSLASKDGNTMAEVARYLHVSPASLTAAVNVLVKKGYTEREYSSSDRRVIYVRLTERGEAANRKYLDFVRDIICYIGADLNEEAADGMIDAIMKMSEYFEKAADGEAPILGSAV